MKRVNKKYPIYSKIGSIPNHAIYALAPSRSNLQYFYIGTSTDPIKRYEKYARACNRSTFENHESDRKISLFREHYHAGVSPVMVLIDSASDNQDAKRLERLYREKYTELKHPLINPTGDIPIYGKTVVKRATNDLIDAMWGPTGVIALIVVGIVLFVAVGRGMGVQG